MALLRPIVLQWRLSQIQAYMAKERPRQSCCFNTTSSQPPTAGRLLVRALLAEISGKPRTATLLPATLVVRGSSVRP